MLILQQAQPLPATASAKGGKRRPAAAATAISTEPAPGNWCLLLPGPT